MIGATITRYFALQFMRTILAIFFTTFLPDVRRRFRRDAASRQRQSRGGRGSRRADDSDEGSRRRRDDPALRRAVRLHGHFRRPHRKLELIAARAAGMSVWQFVAPPMLTALLIGIVSVAIYNPLSASMKMRSDQMEIELFGVPGSLRIEQGRLAAPARRRRARRHARHVLREGRDGALRSERARLCAEGRLSGADRSRKSLFGAGRMGAHGSAVERARRSTRWVGSYMLATELTPEQVAAATTPPQGTPFWSLPEMTARTSEAGLDATGYRLQFQTLLARPLLLIAMVLVAASFSLRFFFRFGGIAKTVSGGVAAGFVIYIVTKVLSDLGGAGMISPVVAAWSPALVGSMLGTLTLLYSEDG